MDDGAATGFLAGGARMGALMRARDWSASPLGDPPTWPQSLRSVVGLLLNSQFPMFVAWGPELGFLYNDAYADILGAKHPAALGARFGDVWPEIWPDIAPLVDAALAGQATYRENLPLLMNRRGFDERTWFTFSYSPVRDEAGRVAGMFCACTETTAQVLAERRRSFRLTLEDRLRGLDDPHGVMAAAARELGEHLGAGCVGYAEADAPVERATVERATVGRDWTAPGVTSVAGSHRLDDFGPALAAALRIGRTVPVEDVATHPLTAGSADAYAPFGTRALVAVPLLKAGRLDAYLFVLDGRPRAWTGDEVTLIEEAAERIWALVGRARAEAALRESEQRFRNMADDAPVMLWITDPTGYCTYLNRLWYDYTGQTEAEALGIGWTRATHPDDQQRAEDAFVAANAARAPFRIEYRLRAADGSHRWAIDAASPRFAGDGTFLGYVGSVTDIHERREAELVLERLNETLEQQVEGRTRERDRLWELSEDLLVTAGYDGRLLRVSPSWTRHLGHSEAALLTRPYAELVHPDDFAAVADALLAMRSSGQPARFEDRVLAADGTWRWFSWTLSPEPGGERLSGVGRDVTALKARQAELDAAQAALRQSQKMEAVGQLTGGLAHDFNNLLTGIAGSLELLETRIAQGRLSEVGRYVAAAQGASRRAAALTHRLLAFSRRQTLDPRPTAPNRLVAGMEELIRRTVGPQVAVEVIGAAGVWTTLVDPNQLENALLNLAINARDAMPDGGRLTVETGNRWLDERAARGRDLPPGQYVSLCVSDTGQGMTPEVAARAFDPFFTTKPIGMGTGLGLSMIYGFVRQSGGQVRIYSEPGQGAMVCLYLPRHLGEAEGAEEPRGPAATPAAGTGETVLVVDDEPTVRMLVAEVLEDLGYTALEAEDGPAGLKVLRSNARIDLLVTDVGLPGGMNGRQVADAARTLRPGLKVLFITGYAENAVVGNGHLDPGMHVMTKPFAMDALAGRIRDLIAGG